MENDRKVLFYACVVMAVTIFAIFMLLFCGNNRTVYKSEESNPFLLNHK